MYPQKWLRKVTNGQKICLQLPSNPDQITTAWFLGLDLLILTFIWQSQ
jgi:hypothetical protein